MSMGLIVFGGMFLFLCVCALVRELWMLGVEIDRRKTDGE